MEIVLVYTIENRSVPSTLETILKLGYKIELEFKNKFDFITNYKRFGSILSLNESKIIGLKGPSSNTNDSTLFEDTVFIASNLEDLFNIELQYITTYSKKDSSHIEELADFYNNIKTINVIPDHDFFTRSETPIDMAFRIRAWNKTGLCNIGMVYSDKDLMPPWKDRVILAPLYDNINQVFLEVPIVFNSKENYNFKWIRNLLMFKKDFIVSLKFSELDYVSHIELVTNMGKNLSSLEDEFKEAPIVI